MKLFFTKQAQKDFEKIKKDTSIIKRIRPLFEILEKDPMQTPPPFKQLTGELKGAYSRRINKKHRLVYRIEGGEVWVIAMWTHYENL